MRDSELALVLVLVLVLHSTGRIREVANVTLCVRWRRGMDKK